MLFTFFDLVPSVKNKAVLILDKDVIITKNIRIEAIKFILSGSIKLKQYYWIICNPFMEIAYLLFLLVLDAPVQTSRTADCYIKKETKS
jgi:hypothetical protein